MPCIETNLMKHLDSLFLQLMYCCAYTKLHRNGIVWIGQRHLLELLDPVHGIL